MRKSRVLAKIRNGEPAICVKLNLRDPRGAEIAARCGFDCIWLDLEHSPNSIDQVEDIVRAAKIYDCDVLTRVEKGGYNDYIKPLEADSTGIMIPHLMSLEEAKQIVYYTKFHPIGRRPLDGGNADGAYTLVDGKEYMETANKATPFLSLINVSYHESKRKAREPENSLAFSHFIAVIPQSLSLERSSQFGFKTETLPCFSSVTTAL